MRNYKRKTERGNTTKDVMERAVKEVIANKRHCREVAKEFNIPHVTLRRYCIKHRSCSQPQQETTVVTFPGYGYAKRHCVFSPHHENLLVQYLLKASKMYFGLGTKEVRRLAYEYANRLALDTPQAWIDNCMAGKDWLHIFLKNNKKITLRTPEATSLGRATSFNRHNVTLFFDNLESLLDKYAFTPDKVWNLDESGCTTVQRPGKIIAETGCKQVGAMTSAERGQLVTICCAISAIGNSVPPMFVFPRVHFKDHFIHGAPVGSIGVANPSGWMTGELFPKFLKHFVAKVNCSKENKVLLILDNHESHITLEVIDFARENGVVLLSFPPHCSHKMQPLDRSVFGPFKTYYNAAADAWMRENKGKTMTIYEVATLVGKAFPRAVTPVNIQAGFKASGICPLDRNIFTDDEFLPSFVTDRPLELDDQPAASTDGDHQVEPVPSTSSTSDNPQTPSSVTTSASASPQTPSSVRPSSSVSPPTPEDVRPFTRAAARKKKGGRKRGSTRILTDSPVRAEIAEAAEAKKLKVTKKKEAPIKTRKPKAARAEPVSMQTRVTAKIKK